MFVKVETTVENHTNIFLARSSGPLGPKGFGDGEGGETLGYLQKHGCLSSMTVSHWERPLCDLIGSVSDKRDPPLMN